MCERFRTYKFLFIVGAIVMIELKGIEIAYKNFIAMKEMSFNIKEGEFFTLLGPSGCGKTSLLRTITGFVQPSKGQIFVDGKDITMLSVEKRGISIVFQSYAIFPTMNVFENIAFGLRVKKISKEEIKERVLETAKMVDLSEEQLQRNASELSGGQQQRVAIARALVLKPKILCLDEPLSNLDARLRQQLRLELKELQRKFGITTLYVTHDQEEALTMSDRIAVFNNGNLEQIGTPKEVFNNPSTAFVANFIGDINEFTKEEFQLLFPCIEWPNHASKCFIRLNHVYTQFRKDAIAVHAKVYKSDYFGLYQQYMFKVAGEKVIRNVETIAMWDVGKEITLYVCQDDFIYI